MGALLLAGANSQAIDARCTAELRERKASIVVPFKPGGLWDLYARTLQHTLNQRTGARFEVINAPAGNGMGSIPTVARPRRDQVVLGMLAPQALAQDHLASSGSRSWFESFHALGAFGRDETVWVTRATDKGLLSRPRGGAVLTGAASNTMSRLILPVSALGLRLVPVHGYQGSTERLAALLRGEIDVLPVTDDSALAFLRAHRDLSVELTLTGKPLAQFPGVPHLGGATGVAALHAQSVADAAARRKILDHANLAVSLAVSTRSILISRETSPALVDCLRRAVQAALADPQTAAALRNQRLSVDAIDAAAVDAEIAALAGLVRQYGSELIRLHQQQQQRRGSGP